MATPRVTIDELPEQTVPEDANLLIVQDSGISKKMTVATLKTISSDALAAHITDPISAHEATAISTTPSGVGVDGASVQAQLGQLTTIANTGAAASADLAAHIADTDDAHDASAISASTDDLFTGTTVQAQLTSASDLIAELEGGVEGPPGPPGPGVAAGGLVGQVLTKVSATDYDTNWQTPTGGGGGGTPLADGDHGDIIVSDSGVTLMFDSGVVTAAARTVLDDTTVAAMRTTLGAQQQDSDLDAIAANSTNGLLTRTGVGTAAARTIQGTSNKITVTNGSGAGGDPTINVGADVYVAAGTDVPVTDGGTGRSTNGTAYGLLAAGTTTTSPHQTISPGTSGHFLVSNGAAALAGFRAPTKADVGLSNVDNTADASKPVFTTSVNGITPASGGGTTNFLRADGTWAAPPGGGGGITGITVAEAGASLDTDITTLDFQAGFDLTESPENEVNVSLDLSEYTGAALPIASGGTGATSASGALTALGGQPLDADLTAVAGNSTNGIYARTGAGTVSARTITGTTGRITVTDGDGVASNPTIDVGANVYVAGGTDIPVTDGGTGASTAAGALTNLGAVGTTRTISTTAPLGGGGDLSANRTLTVSTATEAAVGVVELATTAEAVTGTDTARAVTPAGIAAVVAAATMPIRQTINAQTGTTYTLVLTDENKLVTMTNASASTLTVPSNASVAFPIGARVDLAQLGAGQVTVVAGPGVTINSTPTLVLRDQYSAGSLYKLATDTWLLVGDLAFV